MTGQQESKHLEFPGGLVVKGSSILNAVAQGNSHHGQKKKKKRKSPLGSQKLLGLDRDCAWSWG